MLRPLLFSILLWVMSGASAHAEKRYASIIVDADTLEVLHARQIDEPRFPASLTKVMTLYLVFDAIEAGQIQLEQSIIVSPKAARTPPVKMGLRAGQSVKIDTLIQAVAVRSSNDAAVVLAEKLGGSEAGFAQLMSAKARHLGMSQTEFHNANGLPNKEQKTTARDMAKLGHAMLTNHKKYYHYFGQKSFRGKYNTNRLLVQRDDVDGFKTGYTRASGYNLMVSATRDGRRLIAIVLGGASNNSRNEHMSDLIDRGFQVMALSPAPAPANLSASSASRNRPDLTPVIVTLRGANSQPIRVQTAGSDLKLTLQSASGWTAQIKNFTTPQQANDVSQHLRAAAGNGQIEPSSGFTQGQATYHARVTGLSAKAAQSACRNNKLALELAARRCLIIAP